MSETDESEFPEWAQDYIEDSEGEVTRRQEIPDWVDEEGFERTNRRCVRCTGELVRKHKISYDGIGESIIELKCTNAEYGCDFHVRQEPSDDVLDDS